MSCLGPNYVISITRPWYRTQTICTDPSIYMNSNLNANGSVYIPILKKYVPISELKSAFDMYKKANVLQYDYTHNTNKLTKNQIYALICKGKWTTTKTYATQSDTFTDPNNNYLKRVNYDVINAETGAQTNEPITCPSYTPQTPANTLPTNNGTPTVVPNILPPPPPTPSKNKFILPIIVPVVNTPKNRNIPDGGNLIIGTIENICTGESKIVCTNDPIICFPSSYSDVPPENGVDKYLCNTKGSATWLTSSGINTSSFTNSEKFPTNYKGLVSANAIVSRLL